MFDNRVLRGIFGPKRDEVTGEWRKLHNEELHDLYSSPTVVQVIKWRRIRWVGHVAWMGKEEVCTGFWWGNLRERDHWGDTGIDGRIILSLIFRACTAYGEGRDMYRVLVGKPERKNHWGDPGIDGRIILSQIIRKWDVGVWAGLSWLKIETGGGHL
jgi:hypothetical protein